MRGQGIIVAALLAGATNAWAAGATYPDNGTISIGRGGAWAANPSDGLAFQYNPAGLTQARGWNAYVDARLSFQGLTFTPDAANPAGGPFVPNSASNSAPPFLGPSAAGYYGFGKLGPFDAFTVALGATGPSSIGKLNFPSDGPQRYALIHSNYLIAYGSLAAAARMGIVSFGVTGQVVHTTLEFSQAAFSGTGACGAVCPTDTDTLATVKGNDWSFTGVFGATVHLLEDTLDIGVSYRPGFAINTTGTLEAEPPPSLASSITQTGDDARVALNLPHLIRLGARYDVTSKLDLEINATYERWSSFNSVIVDTLDATSGGVGVQVNVPGAPIVQVPDIVLPKEFLDAYSLRLGGDYDVIDDKFIVRAGVTLESSAVPSRQVSVDFGNWARQAIAVGASVRMFGAWVDLAYAHHFVASQTITNSTVVQVVTPNVLGPVDPTPATVGNGRYTADMNIISLSIRLPFDELTSEFWSDGEIAAAAPHTEVGVEEPAPEPVAQPAQVVEPTTEAEPAAATSDASDEQKAPEANKENSDEKK